MEYQIVRNVERQPRGRASQYPWDSCEIGDEFIVPLERERAVRSAAYNRKKKGERWGVFRTSDDYVAVHRFK